MILSKRKYKILAWLIDVILITFISVIIFFATSNFKMFNFIFKPNLDITFNLFDIYRIFFTSICILIAIVGYYVFVPFFNEGQTLGMRFAKIKYIREDGTSVSFGDIFVRNILIKCLLAPLSFGLFLLVDFIVMCRRIDYKSLADLLVKVKTVDRLDY